MGANPDKSPADGGDREGPPLTSIDTGETALLLAPPGEPESDRACAALVAGPGGDAVDALYLPVTGTIDDRVAARGSPGPGTRDRRIGSICVDDVTRSAETHEPIRTPDGSTTIWMVDHPSDLTGITIKIDAALSGWHDPDRRLSVCIHGLAPLLRHVEIETAFRFIHEMLTRLRGVDAVTHVHLDPDRLDDTEVNSLRMLFDAVLEPDGDAWRVRTRSGRS